MEVKDFVRKRIGYLRDKRKISARSLSLDLGMSTEYVNQVEGGRLNPSLDFIASVCEYFEITLGEFFDQTVEYPMHLKPLIENLKKLNSDELGDITNIVKRLIAKNK